MSDDRIELAALISEVRYQLEKAVLAGKGSDVRFRAGPVELAVDVAVEKKAGADAGVKVWVISATARGEAKQTSTTRVKIELVPIGADGEDLEISSVAEY